LVGDWNIVPLHACELRKCLEVGVAVVEHERMLKHEGRNPHVVGGNRCTLLSQLSIHVAVIMRRLLVGIKDIKPRALEESGAELPEKPVPPSDLKSASGCWTAAGYRLQMGNFSAS